MKKFVNWLNNASIRKKFLPLQFFIVFAVAIISMFSFISIAIINRSSENIIDINVRNKEELSDIVRNMYVCRVLGRDILFAEDQSVKDDYYTDYIQAFNDLDDKMDHFKNHLSGSQLSEFERIIDEKDVYKDSMIKSADIWIAGGSYEDALYALQVVTPIANEFFASIDTFLADEEELMNIELDKNNYLVFFVSLANVIILIVVIVGMIIITKFFTKKMTSSLIKLEAAMSKIAETGNMKTQIPDELYTNDEIGKIAKVSNKMKTMLLEFSLFDPLTGGLNVKAYHEELNEIFEDEKTEKVVWCVISDMNNLKMINDKLGHIEGDNAIRNSYQCIDEGFKDIGKTFRIGGDEFVSLLINCTEKDIESRIAIISQQVEGHYDDAELKTSIAFGYDKFIGKTIAEYYEFFSLVDKKMYDNKVAYKLSRANQS